VAVHENPFMRRLQERRRPKVPPVIAQTAPEGAREKRLKIWSYIAQIAVVIVAIFGYFYTVIPVYQKERLAEQAAEYEGIIKKQTPKIAEMDKQIAATSTQLQS
jgi:cytochrome c-type biogenesis protein CcmH/NrfG